MVFVERQTRGTNRRKRRCSRPWPGTSPRGEFLVLSFLRSVFSREPAAALGAATAQRRFSWKLAQTLRPSGFLGSPSFFREFFTSFEIAWSAETSIRRRRRPPFPPWAPCWVLSNKFKRRLTESRSSRAKIVAATPRLPMRAVRPTQCTYLERQRGQRWLVEERRKSGRFYCASAGLPLAYLSTSKGTLKFITTCTPGMSMPRLANSLASRKSASSAWNLKRKSRASPSHALNPEAFYAAL